MILNTIVFLGYFFLILFSILGFGIAYSRFVNLEYENLSLGIKGILGCFLYTLIAFFTHLFFAHNFTHNIIVNLIGFCFFLYFFIKHFNIYKKKIRRLLFLAISLIILLFISKNNEDFPYYHLPFMINLIENKIQFGIGHFNYSYRTPSSLFYLQSLFYLPGVQYYLLHASGLIILIFANLFFLDKFLFAKSENNHFLKLFSLLSFSFINFFFISLAKYGTDRGGHILAFIIFIIFLDSINNKKNLLSKYKIIFILLIYLISIKNYFLTYLLFFILLLYLIIRNNKLRDFLNSKKLFFSTFYFIFLYLFINFSISGCFLTLIKFTCLDKLFWSTPLDTIQHYNQWYELWAKAGATPLYRVTNTVEYIRFFNWVPNWLDNYFFTKGSDVLLGVIGISIFFFLIISNFKKKKPYKTKNNFFYLYILIIILFVIWFYKHPDLRYGGYVLLASIFFIPLSAYLSKYHFISDKMLTLIVIIIFCSTNIRNIIRLDNEFKRNDHFIYKNFPFFYIKNVEYKIKKITNDVKIYIVNEACWATPSPCLSSSINVKKINSYNFFYPQN